MQATFWWSRVRPTPDKAKPKLRFSERWTPAKQRTNNSCMREKDRKVLYPETKLFLCMIVLYALVVLSVVDGPPQSINSREDMALQKLQYLSDDVQRWEMDQNCRYPHNKLVPLKSKYTSQVSLDPWDNEYGVDPQRGVVFSRGCCDCYRLLYKSWFTGLELRLPANPSMETAKLESTCDKHLIEIQYDTDRGGLLND